MKLRKEFYIKGQKWQLAYKWGLRDSEGERMLGLCHCASRIIEIERAIPQEEKLEIFLHEFLHAIIFESHLSGLSGAEGELVEEVLCDAIASVFVDNFTLRWSGKRRG